MYQPLDLALVAARIAAHSRLLAGTLIFDVVGSTQDVAMERARRGAPEGTLVLARRQESGRGRVGREWFSPPGGLYASWILRPPGGPERWAPLTVIAGIALAASFRDSGASDVRVKWPNDCLSAGSKLAGLLAEARPDEGFVVLGIGINASFQGAPLPPDLESIATTLEGAMPDGADLVEACARAVAAVGDAYLDALPELRVDPGRAAGLLWAPGPVEVAGVRGEITGVTGAGELLMATTDGPVAVSAGEVNHARSG